MALLKIKTFPDKTLRNESAEVREEKLEEVQQLINKMFETLNFFQGLGLAAPQVGIHLNVIVIDLNDQENKFAMINPEIIDFDGEQEIEESCFSIPMGKALVKRPSKIKVKFKDVEWKSQELEVEGLLAQVVQHEYDHLRGVLFIDHISKLKREMIVKKIMKRKIKFSPKS